MLRVQILHDVVLNTGKGPERVLQGEYRDIENDALALELFSLGDVALVTDEPVAVEPVEKPRRKRKAVEDEAIVEVDENGEPV